MSPLNTTKKSQHKKMLCSKVLKEFHAQVFPPAVVKKTPVCTLLDNNAAASVTSLKVSKGNVQQHVPAVN